MPDGVNWLTISYTLTTDSNREVSASGAIPDLSSLGYIPPVTGYGRVTYAGDGTYAGTETAVYTVTLLPATPSPTATPTPTPTPTPMPSLSITSVHVVPGYSQYLEWDISNADNVDAFIAPNALLYKQTDTAPSYAQLGNATVLYAYDSTTDTVTTVYPYTRYGWFNAQAGHTYGSSRVQSFLLIRSGLCTTRNCTTLGLLTDGSTRVGCIIQRYGND